MNNKLVEQLNEIQNLYNNYLEQTKSLSEEQFNFKPTEEKWSVAQVLHHIWFALDGTYLYIDKLMTKQNKFKQAGIVNVIRSFGLNTVLNSSLKLNAPKNVRNAVIKHATHQEIENLASATFQKFRQLLEKFPKELEDKEIYKHPIVGWVSMSQTLGFLKGHTIHHKMQIESLLKSINI